MVVIVTYTTSSSQACGAPVNKGNKTYFSNFEKKINRMLSFDRNILFRSNGTVLGHIYMVVGYLARVFNAPFTGRFGVFTLLLW